MPTVHEAELNIAVAAILDGMRRNWRVSSEQGGVFPGSGKRPDIVISQPGRPVTLIENEFDPARSAEKEARGRLGLKTENGEMVRASIALCSPASLRQATGRGELLQQAKEAGYHFALFAGESPEEARRFPESGWLAGNLGDLAGFAYRASVPAEAVRAAATALEEGVQAAALKMDEADGADSKLQKKIAALLRQEYGDGEQTRRMTMLILINAFVFHYNLAGFEGIRAVSEIKRTPKGLIVPDDLLKEWGKILEVNYWPIFHIAREILKMFSPKVLRAVLEGLAHTANILFMDGVVSSHDLSGRVFQRLIADRKFLATFYTRPASAALLAHLAIPEKPFANGGWKKNAANYGIADFACGTGTLLSAAYQRIAELLERDGGDMQKTHPEMMGRTVTGCDVMPAAVHLTASMLSGMHPTVKFKGTRLFTLAYGKSADNGKYATGSLDLLGEQSFLPVFDTGTMRQTATGEAAARANEIEWRSVPLVIMNPPFTRSTNHEGGHKNIPNPVWAGFGMDAKAQRKIADRSAELRKGTCAHGNAGIASDFVALADKMVAPGGTAAFVLPLSVLAGESWKNVRQMWAKNYDDIRVVSIAAPHIDECSFSADTGMAEILFVGKKRAEPKKTGEKKRGIFIVLNKRPESEIEAGEFARVIKTTARNGVCQLEDAPVSSTAFFAGTTALGAMLEAPLPQTPEDSWGISRIRDMTLAQTAHALINGTFHFFRRDKISAINIPVCRLGEFAKRGPISRDINGTYMGKPRGPFDIQIPKIVPVPTFPCLWAHDAEKEKQLIVEPDGEGMPRKGMYDKASEIWQRTAGRAHYNADFQFNAQPLAVAMTEKPVIGGRAWPSVFLKNIGHEAAYALWGNSTLGVLLYWWKANKQQGGRGGISPLRLPEMHFLDLRKLSPSQLAAARRGFDSAKKLSFLPFHRAFEDDARAELDRIILVDVLGLPQTVLEGAALVREKLCAEPSVRGDKNAPRKNKRN